MSDERFSFSRTTLFLSVIAFIVIGYLFFATPTPKSSNGKAATPAAQAVTTTKPAAVGKVEQSPSQNLAAALAEFSGEADAMKRDAKLDQWIAEVPIDQIPALVELIDHESPSPLNREMKLRLVRKFAQHDPVAAAELVARQPGGLVRQQLLNAVATLWAGQNLQQSITWGRSLPDGERGDVLFNIANESMAADPRQALELAREIPGAEARDELVAHIASEWATKDPDQITDWAEKIEDPALRAQVLSRVAIAWADKDPETAGSLAAARLPAGKTQNDAVVGIVQRWVQKEPAAAAAWVMRFPEGELRQAASAELVNLWADKDYAAAGKWIDQMPDGGSKDRTLGVYVSKIASSHPETAADLVTRITDGALRERQMERIGEVWMASDPTAARTWIRASGLSDDIKEKLLSAGSK